MQGLGRVLNTEGLLHAPEGPSPDRMVEGTPGADSDSEMDVDYCKLNNIVVALPEENGSDEEEQEQEQKDEDKGDARMRLYDIKMTLPRTVVRLSFLYSLI